MSVKVMGLVFDIEGLSPTLKYVLLSYADHASHDGSGVWPAVQSIADKTGYSKRTIQNATKELEKLGYMMKIGQHKSGTNLWQIVIPDMGGAGDSPPGVQEIHEGVKEVHSRGAGDSPKPSLTIKEDPSVKEILNFWGEKFPDKPQPRSTTKKFRDKVQARIKDSHFQENWQEALEMASESITCQKESWFNLYFFLHNEVNYQKCLDRWMSWKDVQVYGENGSEEIDMEKQREKEAKASRERIEGLKARQAGNE